MLRFAPRLPEGLTRLCFHLGYRGRRLRVTVAEGRATYELVSGSPLLVGHYDHQFRLGDEPATREIPALVAPAPVRQPPGREPDRRGGP